jgi:putative CocE/NonD family hydrolase
MNDWYSRLPLHPCPFLVGLSDWHNTWLEQPEDGPYWWQFNVEKYHDQIETPTYHQGGWYDIFLAGTLRNYIGMKRRARTEEARQSQRLVIGPWVHGSSNIGVSKAGEWDFGPEAAQDFNKMRLPWFDHWLKGVDNRVMDELPVRIFVMGRNEWRREADWPLPDTRYTNYYLHEGQSGSINSLNDGTLSPLAPDGSEHPDSFVYDPDRPVPTLGGNTLGWTGCATRPADASASPIPASLTRVEVTAGKPCLRPSRPTPTGWCASKTSTPTGTRATCATASCGPGTAIPSPNPNCWSRARSTASRWICGPPATSSCPATACGW